MLALSGSGPTRGCRPSGLMTCPDAKGIGRARLYEICPSPAVVSSCSDASWVGMRILFVLVGGIDSDGNRLPNCASGLVLVLLGVVGALSLGGASPSFATGRAPGNDRGASGWAVPDSTTPVVRGVHIQGNEHFSEGRLKEQLRTRRNRRVLGIPGFTWWRWVYRLGNADWMWSRVGDALKSGGERPAYLDSTTIAGDVRRLELFYKQHGFFHASVGFEVRSSPVEERATVFFTVAPGSPAYFRHVRYEGLDSLDASQTRELLQNTVLLENPPDEGASLSYRVPNRRYEESTLFEERRRILSYLENRGYAAVSRDSIRAVADTTTSDSVDITFRVETGPQYRFGDVHFQINGPERDAPRDDTLAVEVETSKEGHPVVTSTIEGESQLGTGLLRRSLQFTPGAVYDRSKVVATKQRLEGTGLFTLTSFSPRFDEVDTIGASHYLPLYVEGQTRPRHRLRMETFGLQRGSEVALETNEFGVGLSGVYENVNALGGAETLQLRASGSVASNLDTTLLTSTQFEGTASLTLPYLIRPFGSFENVFSLTNARTRVSLSVLTARRNDIRLRIRSRTNARLRLEMDHTPTRASLVDVVDLSVSNPDPLPGFERQFLDSLFLQIEDPVQREQIREDYTEPQVNTALRYTFRAATANPLRRRSGHIYELSGEVGNSLPLLFDRFIFAPDTIDYSLPGLIGGEGGLSGRLNYRPYIRGTVDLRRYLALSRGSTLGLKLFGGLTHPTAGLSVVPFDRRFFSGGASSIRGWRLRELGPGGAGQQIDFLGGELKLEASTELRTTLLRNILAANWVGAAFVDAGNVWFGFRNLGFSRGGQSEDDGVTTEMSSPTGLPAQENGRFRGLASLREIGVGTGFGLRVEWEYLILRFDLAYRLHDPSPRNEDVFSGRGQPILHFGLGQAF